MELLSAPQVEAQDLQSQAQDNSVHSPDEVQPGTLLAVATVSYSLGKSEYCSGALTEAETKTSYGPGVRQNVHVSQNPNCETCGKCMRQIVWKRPKSVLTKSGTYRRISKSYRCLDCPGALSGRSSEQNLLQVKKFNF